ncbi:MAG TPA: hypothetical protein VL202_04310 [Pararhizobium sp.]|uniref:hypothetical protein n=1 Tax=Pararhizobium sp. TaxID=1977563 RepID=UPI002BD61630|nr:hypothetical protein [Pararhizobium sp.]HTO30392.1 hypothetical protein [Pararhizobium sp.]
MIGRVWSRAADGPVPVRNGRLLDLSPIATVIEIDDLAGELTAAINRADCGTVDKFQPVEGPGGFLMIDENHDGDQSKAPNLPASHSTVTSDRAEISTLRRRRLVNWVGRSDACSQWTFRVGTAPGNRAERGLLYR